MAPVLRPTDPPVGAPRGPVAGAAAPPQAGPGMGMGAIPPGGPPAPPGGPPGLPPVDPAEMEREAMLGLLAQATPVPGTVARLPEGPDTMPTPYFPADAQHRGRRSTGGY